MPYIADRKARDEAFTEEEFNQNNDDIHGELTDEEIMNKLPDRRLLNVGSRSVNSQQYKETPSWWETAQNAAEQEWLYHGSQREHERTIRSTPDPDFVMTEEMMLKEQGMTDDESRHLMGSFSQEDYDGRLQDIMDDRGRASALSDAGAFGLVAQFGAGMLDPVMITSSLLTGPLATATKATRASNALRGAGIAMTESMLLESVMMDGDTQRGWDSFVISALASSAMGGGMGALRRVNADAQQASIIRATDEVDATMHKQAKDLQSEEAGISISRTDTQEQRDLRKATANYDGSVEPTPTAKDVEVINSVNKHTVDLGTRSQGTAMAGRARAKLKKSIKDIEKQIKTIRQNRGKATGAYWAKTGTLSTGYKRQFDETGAWNVAKPFDDEVTVLRMRLEEIQARLDDDAITLQAKKDIKAWKKMTPEQKIKHLHPNYKKTDTVAKEKASTTANAKNETDEAEFESSHLDQSPFDPSGTAGGARVKGIFPGKDDLAANKLDEMDANTSHLDDANNVRIFGSGTLGKIMNTDFTNLGHSASDDIRALARTLLENAQGKNAGNSVAAIQWVNDKLIRSAQGFRVEKGFRQWANEEGISRWDMAMKPEHRDNFNRQTIFAVKGIGDAPTSEGIKLAMDGVRAQYAKALELNKLANVAGFNDTTVRVRSDEHKDLSKQLQEHNKAGKGLTKKSDGYEAHMAEKARLQEELKQLPDDGYTNKVNKGIEQDKNYSPDIMDDGRIVKMAHDMGLGPDKTKALISKGYQTGKNPLTPEQADMFATIKYNQATDSVIYKGDPADIFKARSLKDADALLEKFSIPAKDREEFFAKMQGQGDWTTISNRAKASKGINWEAELDGHKISDLMDTNLDRQLEAYTKETAFNSALGEKGIKSPGQLERILNEAKKRAREETDDAGWPVLEKEFKVLEDSITLLRGQSLVNYDNPLNKVGRMILDYTGLARLQQMGFASIGEISRGIHTAGLSNILRAVPESGMFRRLSSRDAKSMQTQLKSMQEVEEMMGFIGESNLMSSTTTRTDDFGSEASSVMGRALDTGLEYGRRLNHFTSGFQTIQGGFEKITANAINRRTLDGFLGDAKFSKTIQRGIDDSGMSPKRVSEIQAWVKKNGGKEGFSGREVNTWNFKGMPHDMQTDVRVLMTRLNNRAMQKGMVGEANTNWLGAGGRFLTQFRMFVLTSLEKQLVHDWRGDKALAASMLLWSTGLSYLAYGSQVGARGAGIAMAGGDWEEYMDEMMTGMSLHDGAFNKNNVLAGLGLVRDMGSILGALPEEMMDDSRYGYLQQGGFTGAVPALGMLDDGVSTMQSGFNMGWNRFRTDGDIGDDTRNLLNNTRKMGAFTNVIGIGEAFKTMTSAD